MWWPDELSFLYGRSFSTVKVADDGKNCVGNQMLVVLLWPKTTSWAKNNTDAIDEKHCHCTRNKLSKRYMEDPILSYLLFVYHLIWQQGTTGLVSFPFIHYVKKWGTWEMEKDIEGIQFFNIKLRQWHQKMNRISMYISIVFFDEYVVTN